MNANEHNRKLIDQFLQDETLATDSEVAQLLESCDDSRQYFDAQAAMPEQWKEARELLRPAEFDVAKTAEFSVGGGTGGVAGQTRPIQAVLDVLTPSEDPNRLGRMGNYEISGVVGAGGMGVVIKAIDPSLDRVVALKVLAPHLANNELARKRFSREAKAAAAVLHPNVIPIHSVADEGPIPYLVMAYVRGGSLQKRLESQGPLPMVEVLRIGSQIAGGLSAAHDQGLVHRDIKPENILLEEGVERVTITDFGLARAVDDNTVTQHGAIAGTPMYMSPEQAAGNKVDQQSDLFSLGSVLYALCTGQPPYRDDSSYGVMRQIIDEDPTPLNELNPAVPDWMVSIIEKLMAKEKADRFASAVEVHKLLEACLSHVQQPDDVAIPAELATLNEQRRLIQSARRSVARSKPRRWMFAGLAVAVIGVIAIPIYWQLTFQQRINAASAQLRSYLKTGTSQALALNSLNVLLSSRRGHEQLRTLDREFGRLAFAEGDLPHGYEVVASLVHDDRVTPQQNELSLITWREGYSSGPTIAIPNQLRVDSVDFHASHVDERKLSITYSMSTEQQHESAIKRFFQLTPGSQYGVKVNVAEVIEDRVDWIDLWKGGEATGVVSKMIHTSAGSAQANRIEAEAMIRTIVSGLKMHQVLNGGFPSTSDGLQVLLKESKAGKLLKQESDEGFESVLIDPWGYPFAYRYPGKNGANPEVWSLGPDGKSNTGDDICSWQLPELEEVASDGPRDTSFSDKQAYFDGNLTVEKVERNRDGQVEITFGTLAESMFFCPGANAKETDQGIELTFVRAVYNQRPNVDYPAVRRPQGSAKVISIETPDKPILIRSPTGLEPIWHPDTAKIVGTWRVTYSEDGGRVSPQEAIKNIRLVFEEDKISTEILGRKTEMEYTLDPNTAPKSIDFVENGRKKLGIYDLSGDTLRLCIAEHLDARPTAFDSRPDSVNDVVMLMKRMSRREIVAAKPTPPSLEGEMNSRVARLLLPQAASISNEDFARLSASARPGAIENQSLSLVLMLLNARDDVPNFKYDFRFAFDGIPKPSEIADAMSLSRAKGYMSMIQPEYIKECYCNTQRDNRDEAFGGVTFASPIYKGHALFRAAKRDGKWRIERFSLPNRGITIVLGEDGKWKRVNRLNVRQSRAASSASVLFEIPASGATGLAFSPSGKRLAESTHKAVRIWSVSDKQLLQEFETKQTAYAPVFSADGSRVYVADAVPVGNESFKSTIYSWDLRDGRQELIGTCGGIVNDLQVSADGKRMAAAVRDESRIGEGQRKWGSVILWDHGQQTKIKIDCRDVEKKLFPNASDEDLREYGLSEPTHLRFSPDASQLAVTFATKNVMFDAATGTFAFIFPGDGGRCIFQEDDRLVSACYVSNAKGVSLLSRSAMPWDAQAGGFALSKTSDGAIRLHHVKNLDQQPKSLPAADTNDPLLDVSSDGRYVAVGESGTVRVWDFAPER